MKFDEKKKQAIFTYILEKIRQDTPALSKSVAEVFHISQNTVHTYLKEMTEEHLIEHSGRGAYRLVTQIERYEFYRSRGQLQDDTEAYYQCLQPKIESFPENIKRIWQYAVSEMVNNVIDHSEAEVMTVSVIQDALCTEVAIDDNGVGIFRKIKEHFGFSSEEQALEELFKGKLTTDRRNHSGEGIFFTSRMMDVFLIISGGKMFSVDTFSAGAVRELPPAVKSNGTMVYMRLSNTAKRTPKEVFDRFSDVEDGFFKTVLPVNSIFDAAPVSRSQAKRLCTRLEQFKEADFDFAGVDWMGQAFAHQIFVVFQNEHPDIKLRALNMNDDVAAMYRHVCGTAKQ